MKKSVARREAAKVAQREYESILATNRQLLFASGELMSSIFKAMEDGHGRPPEGYRRRPPIGIRLESGNRYLTATPGYVASRTRKEPDGSLVNRPGVIDVGRMNVEVLIKANTLRGKRLVLSARVDEDGAKLRRWLVDSASTKMYLGFMLDTFKALLSDPTSVFAENSDRCSCCGKALTDAVSMTRGIGPECIKYFSGLEEAVSTLRRKYRDLDADWAV